MAAKLNTENLIEIMVVLSKLPLTGNTMIEECLEMLVKAVEGHRRAGVDTCQSAWAYVETLRQVS